jgi:hypothetical protein
MEQSKHPPVPIDWGRGGTVRAQETWIPGRGWGGCRRELGEGKDQAMEETSSSTSKTSIGAWREDKSFDLEKVTAGTRSPHVEADSAVIYAFT